MSLENDITQIKEDMFKPASDAELTSRRAGYEEAKRKEMYINAENLVPGCVDRLKAELKDDAVVEAAIAYADNPEVEKIVGYSEKHGPSSIRNLDWVGIWTDAKTFLKQCKIVGSYNDFDINIAKAMVRDLPGKEFRLGREGSVAVYIRPFTEQEFEYEFETGEDKDRHDNFASDEATWDRPNVARLWWD